MIRFAECIPKFLTSRFAMILSGFLRFATLGILPQYSQGAKRQKTPKGRKDRSLRISGYVPRCLLISAATVQMGFSLEPADRSAIEGVIQGYTDAWNQNECRGFADRYSENADFINIFGMKFSGKEEIEQRHVAIMQSFLKGSKMETVDIALRDIAEGKIIAEMDFSAPDKSE